MGKPGGVENKTCTKINDISNRFHYSRVQILCDSSRLFTCFSCLNLKLTVHIEKDVASDHRD